LDEAKREKILSFCRKVESKLGFVVNNIEKKKVTGQERDFANMREMGLNESHSRLNKQTSIVDPLHKSGKKSPRKQNLLDICD
jgi:hypothetical protein